jgi:peptidoglycan/xylan/chitin deacetylase (PgdA/CDA1 family)
MPVTAGSLARKAVKAAVLPGGVVSRRRAGDVVVLLYHRVGPGPGEIELPAGRFERQLAELAARERVLSLDQALAAAAAPDPAGGVVLSFDDGYRDFHDTVLPLLVRYRLPAVLYLATGLVAEPGRGADPQALRWSELAEAVATGLVTVGAHTHGHTDLSRASQAQAEAEMARSQRLIEDRLGVACRHFAYPWAVASAAADRVARRRFDSAALDAWRTNRRGGLDPWRLGRTPILASDGMAFFRAKVRGRLDGEALAYRALRRGPWRAAAGQPRRAAPC